MWPDRVSNPGPLTYESGALPTALRGPAIGQVNNYSSRFIVCQLSTPDKPSYRSVTQKLFGIHHFAVIALRTNAVLFVMSLGRAMGVVF